MVRASAGAWSGLALARAKLSGSIKVRTCFEWRMRLAEPCKGSLFRDGEGRSRSPVPSARFQGAALCRGAHGVIEHLRA